MANGDLKKQLAHAVRSIQWSYAIFWSISSRQPGVLEWGDGYYNGDIKTRKTIHSVELNEDPLGLQRSEQLRELFESLSAGEASLQAKRPSAALSPEDLTDTEWYYLVCMSFVFNIGQGLPGRTLASGQPTWLCNAHYVESKVFSRSLLAKSASIQTVVCFPFSGGVIELGVTELVLEDPCMIQNIKTSFLEVPYPVVFNKSITGCDAEVDTAFHHELRGTYLITVVDCEEVRTASPKNSSNNKQAEDSLLLRERNAGDSQENSWQFMDDDLGYGGHYSLNSSDCISQSVTEPMKDFSAPSNKIVRSHSPQDVGNCSDRELTALQLQGEDIHYQSVLSVLLKTSHFSTLGRHSMNGLKESSFVEWKEVGYADSCKSKVVSSQKLLKKILFDVPKMHSSSLPESLGHCSNRVGWWKPKANDIATSHLASEKKRDRINERLISLKSLVPNISKVDEESILCDTIEYLQELERRIEELESTQELKESEKTMERRHDPVERTSDNCGSNRIGNGNRPLVYKRKACDIDDTTPEADLNASRGVSTSSISVSTRDEDVIIEIKCSWRDGILLEIVDAISQLHLDSHSVRSTTTDGILKLVIRSKLKGSSAASAGAIKQALHRVARKC